MEHQHEACGSLVEFVGIVKGYLAWRCPQCDRTLEPAEVDFE